MKTGIGLTDGEGVERLWSRLRKLIGIMRWLSVGGRPIACVTFSDLNCSCSEQRERRLVLLDRQFRFISGAIREDLPRWLRRRTTALATKRFDASADLEDTGHSIEYARQQWLLQRATDLSVQSREFNFHAASCISLALEPVNVLRRELKAVLYLQDQIETVEAAIRDASQAIARGARTAASRRAKASIERLRTKQDQLVLEATELYESLNIDGDFQEIAGHGLEFTSTLLQAHEAKRTCRERLVERFHEWSRLDLASGGADEPLGTRQHQRAKQALQKRGPALQRSIQRYNKLCERLALLRPVGSNFPLPLPLSTDLTLVRDDGSYLQDVFLSHNVGPAPAWISDPTLRNAIRAMHVLDRCNEEQVRLRNEAQNFTSWLADEIAAVYAAIHQPQRAHTFYGVPPVC